MNEKSEVALLTQRKAIFFELAKAFKNESLVSKSVIKKKGVIA